MKPWQDKHLDFHALKHSTVRSGVVSMSAQLLKFILNILAIAVLARLLVPEDFGLVAMVMIVVNFFVLFKDAGFSAATVQQHDVTHGQVSLLFWLNVCLGLFLAVVLWFAAPLLAWFFADERLIDMAQVLSLVFLVGGLGVQHEALMRRQMRFRGLAVIEVLSLLFAVMVALILAWQGMGYWAMVWMQVIAVVLRVCLLWIWLRWLPSLPVLKVGVQKMVMFGGQLTLANIIHYISRQSDQWLLGWSAGAHALGLYSTAMQMLMMPIRQVLTPVTQVAITTLSRFQHDDVAYRNSYLRLVNVVAYLTMPMMALLVVLSEPVVLLFLGEGWHEAVGLVAILAAVGWILPINNTMGWILTSLGKGKRMLYWNIFMAPVFLAAFALGIQWGAEGVAWAMLVVVYASRFFHFRYVLKESPIALYDLLQFILWPAILSFLTAGLAWLLLGLCSDMLLWQKLVWPLLAAFSLAAGLCYVCSPIKKDCMTMITWLRGMKSKEGIV